MVTQRKMQVLLKFKLQNWHIGKVVDNHQFEQTNVLGPHFLLPK